MPKSSPGGLCEALGPANDHHAIRIGPHDVGVVIDLDPFGRGWQLEQGCDPLQQFRLAGALGKPAFERLAGVRLSMGDDGTFLPTLRM